MGTIDEELAEVTRGAVTVETAAELREKWRRSRASGTPLRIKLGIDPTSAKLHLGFTVPLRKLRQFQDAGHLAVLIIGDYTACVGDPTGRNQTRPTLAHEEVRRNAADYLEQAWRVLDRERTEVVHNGDWFQRMSFLDVIDLCSRTTVARQLERDDFAKRYGAGTPISLHEFIYPLMQARDSVEVRADLELGGTDQTFNLLLGRDLMRQAGLEPQVCLTLPLLVGTDGVQKMSKSYGNDIGIAEPPEEMYGKVMSIPDAAMRSYYLLVTDLSLEAIETELLRAPRDAKASLARHLVRMYHGEDSARRAEAHFDRVFRDREAPEEMEELRLGAADAPGGGIRLLDLVLRSGLASGGNDARRKMQGGGVTIDGQRCDDPNAAVTLRDGQVLRVGKKGFRRIRLGG
jgi:tyrosyl-tRNA synthetase